MSVCGTTQQSVLDKLLDSEAWASGLAPRLIMACPPSDFRLYKEPPDAIPGQADYGRILKFCAIEFAGNGLELRLDPAAKEHWQSDLNFRNKFDITTQAARVKRSWRKLPAFPRDGHWFTIAYLRQDAAPKRGKRLLASSQLLLVVFLLNGARTNPRAYLACWQPLPKTHPTTSGCAPCKENRKA